GLAALSMHKLGAVLGVKGMSLYNHVVSKDDLFDGIIDVLWSEVETAAPVIEDWLAGARALAHAIRAAVARHPNAAPLITSRPFIPIPALRLVRDHISAAVGSGVAEERAYAVLRTLTMYALGSAFAEVCWGMGGTCRPTVRHMLRRGTPEELAAVAEVFCGQSDADAMFELGVELMLHGVDCTHTP
ncbi:MAG: TetR/AcrR family transcriptional regulator C-terminal domain-containing protein, partial [Sciscionella sp.]